MKSAIRQLDDTRLGGKYIRVREVRNPLCWTRLILTMFDLSCFVLQSTCGLSLYHIILPSMAVDINTHSRLVSDLFALICLFRFLLPSLITGVSMHRSAADATAVRAAVHVLAGPAVTPAPLLATAAPGPRRIEEEEGGVTVTTVAAGAGAGAAPLLAAGILRGAD